MPCSATSQLSVRGQPQGQGADEPEQPIPSDQGPPLQAGRLCAAVMLGMLLILLQAATLIAAGQRPFPRAAVLMAATGMVSIWPKTHQDSHTSTCPRLHLQESRTLLAVTGSRMERNL